MIKVASSVWQCPNPQPQSSSLSHDYATLGAKTRSERPFTTPLPSRLSFPVRHYPDTLPTSRSSKSKSSTTVDHQNQKLFSATAPCRHSVFGSCNLPRRMRKRRSRRNTGRRGWKSIGRERRNLLKLYCTAAFRNWTLLFGIRIVSWRLVRWAVLVFIPLDSQGFSSLSPTSTAI